MSGKNSRIPGEQGFIGWVCEAARNQHCLPLCPFSVTFTCQLENKLYQKVLDGCVLNFLGVSWFALYGCQVQMLEVSESSRLAINALRHCKNIFKLMISHSFKFYFHLNFCYENMHVHVSLSSTFDIKISGWTKAIKSTEMNL